MSTQPTLKTPAEMLAELQRLIDAIDRRVPQPDRSAEPKIAREAADLRARAVTLMGALLDETQTANR